MKWGLRALVAVASVLTGYLHYDLWANHQYRFTPVREMFILQAVVSVVAGLVAFAPIRWAPLAAAVVSAGSLVAFALSRTSLGVPTLHGKFTETGLAPDSAAFLGLRTTVVVLVAEVVAIVGGIALVTTKKLA